LEKFGITELVHAETNEQHRCLCDGDDNYIWFYDDGAGVTGFTCYALLCNYPIHILHSIADLFNVRILSEHDPEYWGFATWEEMDAAFSKKEEAAA
jgi:hypothetical protein